MWKGSIYLLILVLLVSRLLVPHVFASDSCVAIQPYFCLPTTNGFTLDSYGTTVSWASNIYFTSYTLFHDHIYFVSASLGGISSQALTFGLGDQGGNTNVTQVSSSAFTDILSAGNESFYYPSGNYPASVTINSSTISASSYYTSPTSFLSASAPAIYLNLSCVCLNVNAGAKYSTTISFTFGSGTTGGGQTGGGSSTTSTSSQTSTSTTYSENALTISDQTVTVAVGNGTVVRILVDNSANSSPLTILSVTAANSSGATIVSDTPQGYSVPAMSQGSILLQVTGLKAGTYTSAVVLNYQYSDVSSNTLFHLTIHVGSKPSYSTNDIMAGIIALIVAVAGSLWYYRRDS